MTFKKRVTVLVFAKRYLPGYRAGGPIRTLANLVERLGDEIEFRIITLDRDLGGAAYPGIVVDKWVTLGKAEVFYVEASSFSFLKLLKFIKNISPDCIYLNGFLDPVFTQRVLWARRLNLISHNLRVVLAPRGEFSEAALSLKKLKKKIYLRFARAAGLCKGISWQASSTMERDDILKSLDFLRAEEVKIARNLAPSPEKKLSDLKDVTRQGELRVCFLARISPIKNLDFALRVLCEVDVPVLFTIYGPKEEEGYWNECMALISKLPDNIRVDYKGIVTPQLVRSSLSNNDLFFFPTRGENYGHVIHEALSAGLPVLISDKTPWNSVEKEGVGWNFPLDQPENFRKKIEEIAGWDEKMQAAVRQRAIVYGDSVAADKDALDQNRALFR